MSTSNLSDTRIVVVGTGYVGLPAALMLAKAGYKVIGVDINENIVSAINEGVLLIKEDHLDELMQDEQVKANLSAQTMPAEGDVFFIAVPTPLDSRKKVADLSYVIDAMNSMLPVLKEGNLIVLESTVPPLTCRELLTPMIEQATGLVVGETIYLAHCPERILPGDVFREIIHNDRIIGAKDEKTRQMAADVYSSFVKGKMLLTDDITAELAKLMENTYRDVNIALANEFNAVAQALDIDGEEVIALANRHPRVSILRPGIGVGGHCIPIDPWFIKEVDPANSRLIFTARMVNDEMPHKIAAKIRQAVREAPNPRIVALGASYKPNTEDTRESPALEIVELLREDGFKVDHYDPLVKGDYAYVSLVEAARDADCLAFLVEHDALMADFENKRSAIEKVMKQPIFLRF